MIGHQKSLMQKVTCFLWKIIDWIILCEDDDVVPPAQEYAKTHPEFEKFLEAILAIKDEKERKQMYRLLRSGMEF